MRRVADDGVARRVRTLSLLGLLGIVEFLVAAVAVHAASLGDEPSHMSGFVHTRFSLVWTLGLYTLVLACGALAWALRPCLLRTRWLRAGMALLALAGLAAFVLATFPVDDGLYQETLVGTIHNEATLTAFLFLCVAMVVLAPAFRATPGWRTFAGTSLGLGAAVGVLEAVCLYATEQDLGVAALSQRVLVACVAAWFVLIALRLRRAPLPAPAPE